MSAVFPLVFKRRGRHELRIQLLSTSTVTAFVASPADYLLAWSLADLVDCRVASQPHRPGRFDLWMGPAAFGLTAAEAEKVQQALVAARAAAAKAAA